MDELDTHGSGESPEALGVLETRDTLVEHGATTATWWDPPFSLGRYQVNERIGRGGAGVVFRARDPQLARDVAIKVVAPRTMSERARSRLLGEAQAIARLSHPNVVAVFDVGELPSTSAGNAAGIYMVMELLEGVSLRRWLAQGGHAPAEILDVLLAAGRGLEAAHRAGLVHRDFKPDNVLVGSTGRVHVLDFGLAQLGEPGASTSGPQSEQPETIEISGTPAYMAPEQHAGASNDARTDLFAFCATCWEAIHGVHPYEGRTLDALERHKLRGCGPPPTRRPPRWLHDAIASGLAPDPSGRPTSMTALLDGIARRRHRRRNVIVGAVATSVIGGAFALAWTRGADTRACVEQGEARLSRVWNDEVRDQAGAQFERVGLPYAKETFARAQALLDERALAWREARTAVCEGALGGGAIAVEQSATALACLDQQLEELGARVEVFGVADVDVVRQATRMAERLAQPARCLDAAWVAAEQDGFGGALEAQLLRIRVHHELGHYDDALAAAKALVPVAQEAGDHRRHARALLQACRAVARGRQHPEAIGLCTDAWVQGERANSTAVVVSAMLKLLSEADPGDEREAERLERLIRARLDARPQEQHDGGLDADFALVLAQRHRPAGRWHEARVQAQHAYDISVQSHGADDAAVVSALNELALSAEELGELDHARALFAEASAILLTARGRGHPDVVSLENNLAGLEIALGRHDQALERLDRVLAEKRAIDGDRSTWLLTTMYQQVEAHIARGAGGAAVSIARDGLALAEEIFGQDSRALMSPLESLASALRAQGRCEEAIDTLGRLDALGAGADVRDAELDARSTLERARCLAALGRDDEAGPSFAAATTMFETLYGASARRLAEVLLSRAQWEQRRGDRRLATALLQRAAGICATTEGDPAVARSIADALTTLR